MKIPYVKKINTKLKYFKVKQLCDIIKKCTNAEFDQNGRLRKVGLTNSSFKIPSYSFSSFEKVADKMFYYTNKGKIYFSKSGTLTQVKSLNMESAPIFVEIIKDGERKPIILNGTGLGYVVENDGTSAMYEIPTGKIVCVYNNMLFVANGNHLYFSAVGDCTDFTMDLNHAGFIKTDVSDGVIVALTEQDGKLVIFTQRAVYEFNAEGGRLDYTLKRVLEFDFNGVLLKTVKNCLGKIIFIANNQMFYYDDKKITKIDDALYLSEYSAQNFAGVDNGIYYFSMSDGNGNYKILRYDIKEKKHCVIDAETPSVCDDGYVLGANGQILFMSNGSFPELLTSLEGVDLDLGTAKEKVLHVISLFSSEQGQMVIDSEIGSRKFGLKKGANLFRVNIPTNVFKLSFSGKADFTVNQIKIEYRIKEN